MFRASAKRSVSPRAAFFRTVSGDIPDRASARFSRADRTDAFSAHRASGFMAPESNPAASTPIFAVPDTVFSAAFPMVFATEEVEDSARLTVFHRVAVFDAAESHFEPTIPRVTWVAKLERSSACFAAGSFPNATPFSFQYSTAHAMTEWSEWTASAAVIAMASPAMFTMSPTGLSFSSAYCRNESPHSCTSLAAPTPMSSPVPSNTAFVPCHEELAPSFTHFHRPDRTDWD